jgi:hypothetical protein
VVDRLYEENKMKEALLTVLLDCTEYCVDYSPKDPEASLGNAGNYTLLPRACKHSAVTPQTLHA